MRSAANHRSVPLGGPDGTQHQVTQSLATSEVLTTYHTSSTVCRAIGAYGCALALCLLILVSVMELWHADLTIPLSYVGDDVWRPDEVVAHSADPTIPFTYKGGDNLLVQMWVRTLVDNAWYLHNDYVGMPTGLDMHDFPCSDSLHYLLMKLIAVVTRNYAVVVNTYFLLTFPLTTLSSLFVLRRFNLSFGPSIVTALLYTFLPYHFFRGQHHLFLASYYLVPLVVLVILWIYLDQFSLIHPAETKRRTVLEWLNSRFGASLAICFVFASAGVYYALFSCYFLLVAGGAACFRRRTVRPLCLAAILVLTIGLGLIANGIPTFAYRWQHGSNASAVRRAPGESESNGLKVIQLLLPVHGHRLSFMAALKARYLDPGAAVPLNYENILSSLGIIGSVGVLVLLGQLLRRIHGGESDELMEGLSLLHIFAILLGTIGGFGSLLALLISPWIRAYNRISIYIAFFALFAVASLLDRVSRRYLQSVTSQMLWSTLLGFVLVLGVLDQTSPGFVPPYSRLQQEFNEDAEFVRRIEACMPQGAMIFQLPQMPFPEHGKLHRMHDYAHFRAYLHSQTLRWSYGALKGRVGDRWQEWVSKMRPDEMVRKLSSAGFSGIYLDRAGFADKGARVITELSQIFGKAPIESANGRMVFFSMMQYNDAVDQSQRDSVENGLTEGDLFVCWMDGFYNLEQSGDASWRWCMRQGTLCIYNPLREARQVRLEMGFQTGHEKPAQLHITGSSFSERLMVSCQPTCISTELSLPPGSHEIKFTCNAAKVRTKADSRRLIFRVLDCSVQDVTEERRAAFNL